LTDEKYKKKQNPLYSLLIKDPEKGQENLEDMVKKKMKTKIINTRKNPNKAKQIESKDTNRYELIYKSCMEYYKKSLENKKLDKIKIDEIIELGDLFYIINKARRENKKYNIEYINFLIKNNEITKKQFGPFSWFKGDSQKIGESIGKIKIETQNSLDNEGVNVFFNESTLFLILKVKKKK